VAAPVAASGAQEDDVDRQLRELEQKLSRS
jgi:hypothetical protein